MPGSKTILMSRIILSIVCHLERKERIYQRKCRAERHSTLIFKFNISNIKVFHRKRNRKKCSDGSIEKGEVGSNIWNITEWKNAANAILCNICNTKKFCHTNVKWIDSTETLEEFVIK